MTQTPDYTAITSKQRDTWAMGDFNVIALSIMAVSEGLVASVDPHAGQRVLDVACGSGNTALIAARRYCDVVGVDYVPALIERGRQRAAAEGCSIELQVGDAQALPCKDDQFDVVLSTFGVMFAPEQQRAAAELARVCRPGGVIGLCNWRASGNIGEFFRIVSSYMPPPAGVKSPLAWGDEGAVRELLGGTVRSVRATERTVNQYYRSVDHILATYRQYFGPTRRAFDTLDEAGRAALERDLTAFYTRANIATDGTVILPCQYLELLAVAA
ncbi:MAG: class I SAM-dependent methyltransferase [Polyangiaceae bacterium]